MASIGPPVATGGPFCDKAAMPNPYSRYPLDYGRQWPAIAAATRLRARGICARCHRSEVDTGQTAHVHHRIPVRSFLRLSDAHRAFNLVVLCPACHSHVEPRHGWGSPYSRRAQLIRKTTLRIASRTKLANTPVPLADPAGFISS